MTPGEREAFTNACRAWSFGQATANGRVIVNETRTELGDEVAVTVRDDLTGQMVYRYLGPAADWPAVRVEADPDGVWLTTDELDAAVAQYVASFDAEAAA